MTTGQPTQSQTRLALARARYMHIEAAAFGRENEARIWQIEECWLLHESERR